MQSIFPKTPRCWEVFAVDTKVTLPTKKKDLRTGFNQTQRSRRTFTLEYLVQYSKRYRVQTANTYPQFCLYFHPRNRIPVDFHPHSNFQTQGKSTKIPLAADPVTFIAVIRTRTSGTLMVPPGDALHYLLYIQMVVHCVPPKHFASPREKLTRPGNGGGRSWLLIPFVGSAGTANTN